MLGAQRDQAVAFSIGNFGYVATGYTNAFAYENDLVKYNPETNSWAQMPDFLGGGRMNAVAFSIGDKGYIGTGVDGSGVQYSDFWEYDSYLNIWTQKADFGGYTRAGAVGFVMGNKGYITSGFYAFYQTDMWEYNPATNTWTERDGFAELPRRDGVGFSIGEYGYIWVRALYNNVRRNDFWQFSLAAAEINITQNATSIADEGSYNFGDVNLTASTTKTFTIQNTGSAALNLTSNPRVTLSGQGFTLVSDAPAIVPANGTATFVVFFTPQSCGSASGNIVIQNSDPNEGSYNFQITGNAIDNIAPTLVCAVNQTVNLSQGQSAYKVPSNTLDPVQATDNCGVSSISNSFNNGAILAGAQLPPGVNTIVWQIIDVSGNTITCSSVIRVNVITQLEDADDDRIMFYPNPNSGFVHYSFSGITIRRLRSLDVAGKEIKSFIPENQQGRIDMTVLPTGIYLLQLESDKGLSYRKIMKE